MTRRSARRTLTMRLGRTSRSCGFWLPRASASTSTRSPPTASVSALRSVVVATTRTLSAAAAVLAAAPRPATEASAKNTNHRMGCLLSERVRGVRAQDECRLQQQLVDISRAAAVEVDAVAIRSRRVLVAEPKAQKLGGHERQIRTDRPLVARVLRILGPVIPEPERPQAQGAEAERLELAVGPGAEAVQSVRARGVIGHAVTVGVRAGDIHVADLVERFAGQREERVLPAVGFVLVFRVGPDDRVAKPIGRVPAGHGRAELQRAPLLEIEEGPRAPCDEGILEAVAAEGHLVVSVEHAGKQLEEKRQGWHPREFRATLDEPVLAEESHEHVGPVDEGQIVLVNGIGEAEAIAHEPELGLRAEGQGHERKVRLREAHGDVAAILLPRFESHLGAGVGIDLTEQAELDLAREEQILEAGEGPAGGLLHVVLRQVAHEIARDAHVEKELARATLLIERKW